jgi:hypothetical protein
MKTLLIWTLAGALLGVAAASVIVPPALSWYSAPGGLPEGASIQALVAIPEVIRYSTGKLIRGQAIGGLVGAVIGMVIGIVLRRKPSHGDAAQGSSQAGQRGQPSPISLSLPEGRF